MVRFNFYEWTSSLFEKEDGYGLGANYYNRNDFAPNHSSINLSQLSTPKKMELFRFLINIENSQTIEETDG